MIMHQHIYNCNMSSLQKSPQCHPDQNTGSVQWWVWGPLQPIFTSFFQRHVPFGRNINWAKNFEPGHPGSNFPSWSFPDQTGSGPGWQQHSPPQRAPDPLVMVILSTLWATRIQKNVGETYSCGQGSSQEGGMITRVPRGARVCCFYLWILHDQPAVISWVLTGLFTGFTMTSLNTKTRWNKNTVFLFVIPGESVSFAWNYFHICGKVKRELLTSTLTAYITHMHPLVP